MASQNMDRLNKIDPFVALVAIPPVLGAITWLVVLVLAGATGNHPIWDLQPRNLAEAAAFRDAGAVVRRVDAGEDPDGPGEVRAGVILAAAATLVPIEAAAASREAGTVQLLLDLGASPDADSWQRAWCISDASDVRSLLAMHRPDGALEECGEP
jgi:hypothetical protein